MDQISAIIKKAGGPKAIAAASQATRKPISIWAVHKWRAGGIPDDHWPMLMSLSPSLTVETLYRANLALSASSRPSRGNAEAVAA